MAYTNKDYESCNWCGDLVPADIAFKIEKDLCFCSKKCRKIYYSHYYGETK